MGVFAPPRNNSRTVGCDSVSSLVRGTSSGDSKGGPEGAMPSLPDFCLAPKLTFSVLTSSCSL